MRKINKKQSVKTGYFLPRWEIKSNILRNLLIALKWKKVRILKKNLNITFINPNTEEQIVQAMAGYLAYSLDEKNEK